MGGFSSHLVTPNSPKPKITLQPADVCETADLDGKRVLLKLGSDNAENVSTPTRVLELAESDTNSDPEKSHFSKTLGKYLTCLKSIKRPRINNSVLLDGVNQVSRSIEGCIKLAESTLGSSTSRQNPEALNPPKDRSGDILSGIDRVDSKLADCIKMAEGTLQNLKQKSGGGIYSGSGKTNLRLVRIGPSISRKPQNHSLKPAHSQIPKTTDTSKSFFDQDFDQFMNGLDNFEPFDDLEDWSDNVDLFMDVMANPPEHADALWELAKLKIGKAKAPE